MVSKHCFAAPDAHSVSAVLGELAQVEKRVGLMIRTRPMPTRSERDEMVLETANTILTIRIVQRDRRNSFAVPSLLPDTTEQAFVSGV